MKEQNQGVTMDMRVPDQTPANPAIKALNTTMGEGQLFDLNVYESGLLAKMNAVINVIEKSGLEISNSANDPAITLADHIAKKREAYAEAPWYTRLARHLGFHRDTDSFMRKLDVLQKILSEAITAKPETLSKVRASLQGQERSPQIMAVFVSSIPKGDRVLEDLYEKALKNPSEAAQLTEQVKALIISGKDITGDHGYNLLVAAIKNNDNDMIDFLIDNGAKPLYRPSGTKESVLDAAMDKAISTDADVVGHDRFLSRIKVEERTALLTRETLVPGNLPQTPMTQAILGTNSTVLRLLMKHGAHNMKVKGDNLTQGGRALQFAFLSQSANPRVDQSPEERARRLALVPELVKGMPELAFTQEGALLRQGMKEDESLAKAVNNELNRIFAEVQVRDLEGLMQALKLRKVPLGQLIPHLSKQNLETVLKYLIQIPNNRYDSLLGEVHLALLDKHEGDLTAAVGSLNAKNLNLVLQRLNKNGKGTPALSEQRVKELSKAVINKLDQWDREIEGGIQRIDQDLR